MNHTLFGWHNVDKQLLHKVWGCTTLNWHIYFLLFARQHWIIQIFPISTEMFNFLTFKFCWYRWRIFFRFVFIIHLNSKIVFKEFCEIEVNKRKKTIKKTKNIYNRRIQWMMSEVESRSPAGVHVVDDT